MSDNNQTIKRNQKGRGGARPNAGRKKSAVTTKTREIADKVIAGAKPGETPLEVMLSVMGDLMTEAKKIRKSIDPDDKKAATKLLMMAADVAKDAAPYIHPRLANVSIEASGEMSFTITTGVPKNGE